MSLIIEDGRVVPSMNNIQPARHSSRLITNGKQKTLRLDSPTTLEACKELGILPEQLKPKTVDDFKEPNVPEDIIQLRFAHHQKRYNQIVIDVYAARRQIVRAQQRQHRQQQQQIQQHQQQQQLQIQTQPAFDFITGTDIVGTKAVARSTSRSNINQTLSPPPVLKYSLSHTHSFVQSPMMSTFHKAISYMRKSHDTSEVKGLHEILVSEDGNTFVDEASEFDHALANEVAKFNKAKRQKQKEAKDLFQEDLRKLKLQEDLQEREKKMKEREKRIKIENQKNKEEKRRKAKEKLEKIKNVERRYEEKKEEEKERQKQKLEDIKYKLAEEAEERKRLVAEHERKLEEKKKIADERREKVKQDEQDKADQLKREVQEKLFCSQEKHDMILHEKTSRIKHQIMKIEESTKRIKVKQEQDVKDYVQQLVQKLVDKEENFKALHQMHLKEAKKKEKQIEEKNKRLVTHQSFLERKHEDKMADINERFQRVQENLEAKKEQNEATLKLKQELRKLKVLDKQDNYNRKIRQIQYKQQKVLDKEKLNQEKIQWLKGQRNVIQQAKVEVSIQSKIERDRIEMAVQLLSKITNEAGTSITLNEHQKKLLKEVLSPEDYYELEEEERRRKEIKLETEVQAKPNLTASTIVKAR